MGKGSSKLNSLSQRLLAVFFFVSFGVMCAATCAATAVCYTAYESKAEDALLSQASECAQDFAALSTDEMVRTLANEPFMDVRCTLIDADGNVLFDNYADPSLLDNHADREEVRQAKESGQVAIIRRSATFGTDTVYAAASVNDDVVLRLAESRVSLASFLGSMALPLAVSFVAIFLISLLTSRVLTKMITRPFSDIDLANPLDNDAYEEIQPLLERVDAQRRELEGQNAELERAVFARREFTGNVSHEMKTPLQVIGGYAELMESGMVDAADVPRFAGLVRQEADAMRGLIDDVLTLSRLDERTEVPSLPIDLPMVAKRVCARLALSADERKIDVQQCFDPAVVIRGDESLAEQMIYNLVSNAIKYNKDGGVVRVTVKRVPHVSAAMPVAQTDVSVASLHSAADAVSAVNATGAIGSVSAANAASATAATAPAVEVSAAEAAGTIDTAGAAAAATEVNEGSAIADAAAATEVNEGSAIAAAAAATEVSATPKDGKTESVIIAVDDEGPGIPPEMRERVFERFFRVDSSRSRETGGTGLGLAIVKHAALGLGGSVHVEDSDLGGSRFVVML